MKPSTLLLPLTISGPSLDMTSGNSRILQSVALYFATPQGSRCLVPEFGVPPAPVYAPSVPGWVDEVQTGLLLLQGVTRAVVLVALGTDGRQSGVCRHI
jgi:hypothetical protein